MSWSDHFSGDFVKKIEAYSLISRNPIFVLELFFPPLKVDEVKSPTTWSRGEERGLSFRHHKYNLFFFYCYQIKTLKLEIKKTMV